MHLAGYWLEEYLEYLEKIHSYGVKVNLEVKTKLRGDLERKSLTWDKYVRFLLNGNISFTEKIQLT